MGKRTKTDSPRRGRVAALVFGTITAGALVLAAGRADAVTLVDQESDVDNSGVAVANSGGNVAVGNTSENRTRNEQRARSGAAGDDSVAANIGSTSNRSDGSATIHTGDATAVGNHSATNQSQAVATGGGRRNVVIADQDSDVDNSGLAIANTGLNTAVGNASENRARNEQRARAGAADEDSVAVNIGDTTNHSDGSATITTGDAWAAGNVSSTNVAQALWAGDDDGGMGGITVVDQEADVDNTGFALANTGLNAAVGNDSFNRAVNEQFARAGGGDDVVAVNIGGTGNWSDGTAWIGTGNATAIGNLSATSVCQGIGTFPACPRAVLPAIGGGTGGHTSPPAVVHHQAHHVVHHRAHHATHEMYGVGGGSGLWFGRTAWGHGGGSSALARTGGPLALQAVIGGVMLGLGALLRRRR